MRRKGTSVRNAAARAGLIAGCTLLLLGIQPAWAGQTITPNVDPDAGSGATDVTITGIDRPQTTHTSQKQSLGNTSRDLAQTGVASPLAVLAIAACGSCALFAATSENPSHQQ